MKFRTIVSLVFILNSVLFSQIPETFSQFDVAINLYAGFPQKEFKENINRNGYGLNAEGLLKPFIRSPFYIGLNLGFLNYGSVTRREPFSYTIPDVFVNVTNQNNILNYHLVVQLAPQFGIFKPYVQFLFGGSYISTETKIENISTQEEIARSTNFEDYAWSNGVAAGMMFRILQGIALRNNEKSFNELFINIKVSYLSGSNAKYLKEGSIRYLSGGRVEYDVMESKTDLIGLHLGVTFTF